MDPKEYKEIYDKSLHKINDQQSTRAKSGVICYNRSTSRVLVIQSCSAYFGFPKGSYLPKEAAVTCALRELGEETGLELTTEDLDGKIELDAAVYFFSAQKDGVGKLQYSKLGNFNDATGIGWIKPACLEKLAAMGSIRVNSHAKRLLQSSALLGRLTFN